VTTKPGNWLLYDGECPFCSRYVRLVRLRDAIGPLRLIDARLGGSELSAIRAAGLDINTGMVLSLNGRLYHGDACINRLALLSTPSGAFNRLNGLLFRSPWIAKVSYPLMRSVRNGVLRLLGRSLIPDAAPLPGSGP
jgi:predicted DCC family thiol-disulfide oxidoreductase YuxK